MKRTRAIKFRDLPDVAKVVIGGLPGCMSLAEAG